MLPLLLRDYGSVLVALLALDAVWLWARADYHNRFFYAVQQAPLTVRLLPAAGVYLLLAAALTWIAVLEASSVQDALLRGAVVGGVMYGFYDLTNYATLARWTLGMTVTDTVWGTLAGAAAAGVAYWMLHKRQA
jgi:uncharacterized membrane protein